MRGLLANLVRYVRLLMRERTLRQVAPRSEVKQPMSGRGRHFQYRVRITAPSHERILHASSEREAALKAEAVLRQLHERGMPSRCRVEAPVGSEAHRLQRYIDGVIRDLEVEV